MLINVILENKNQFFYLILKKIEVLNTYMFMVFISIS